MIGLELLCAGLIAICLAWRFAFGVISSSCSAADLGLLLWPVVRCTNHPGFVWTGAFSTVTSWVVGFIVGAVFASLSYLFYMVAVGGYRRITWATSPQLASCSLWACKWDSWYG